MRSDQVILTSTCLESYQTQASTCFGCLLLRWISYYLLMSSGLNGSQESMFGENGDENSPDVSSYISSQSSTKIMPPAARPYRSSKRNRPCDRCRETKIRCQVITGSQCAKCQRDGLHCSFSTPDRTRLGYVQHAEGSRTPTPAAGHSHESSPGVPWSRSPIISTTAGSALQHTDLPLPTQPTPPKIQETDIQFNTQFSQSLEAMQDCSAQLFGSSSESDPWLLRHCKFDDFGIRSFQNTRYRTAGGLPLAQKIPIHLIIEPNELHETAKEETRAFDRQIASRADLDRVVPLDCGQRLVAL